MSDMQKKYLTVRDVMENAVAMAKTDPRYAEFANMADLDYEHICGGVQYDQLKLCEFDVIGYTNYGGSEGIYGDIFFYGEWVPSHNNDPFRSRMRVYVLKTLCTDKDAYLAVGMLVNLICYYANEFVREHLARFD